MTYNVDFSDLLISMLRCNYSYYDEKSNIYSKFNSIGSKILGFFKNNNHQAVVHITKYNKPTLTITGSRITCGSFTEHFGDLFADLDCDAFDLGNNVKVAHGSYLGMKEVWDYALNLFPKDSVINVEGHSLGGQRACLTPLFLDKNRIGNIFAFEAPKAGNDIYWKTYLPNMPQLISIVNNKDPFADWPWNNKILSHGSNQLLWLHNNTWSWDNNWKAGTLKNMPDHFPENVIKALQSVLTNPTNDIKI